MGRGDLHGPSRSAGGQLPASWPALPLPWHPMPLWASVSCGLHGACDASRGWQVRAGPPVTTKQGLNPDGGLGRGGR